jgi:signal transduction histidine kinase/ActR/RegA family two-component response regulator
LPGKFHRLHFYQKTLTRHNDYTPDILFNLSAFMTLDNNAGFTFMSNGGEMGALMRDVDWSQTELGEPEQWPETLKITLRLILTSNHAMFIFWGEHLIQFYNDAYRQTLGPERHPSALGQRGRECWQEIWDIIGPQITSIMAGGDATWHENQLLPVTRHGRREDVYWTYGYSPIQDSVGVRGVLVICSDVTVEHTTREELKNLNAQLTEQLRLRDEANRRQRFRLEMTDSIRGLVESSAAANVTFRLLAQYMNASRVFYCDIDDRDGSFSIPYEWRREGLKSLLGLTGNTADFGPKNNVLLSLGQILAVSDVSSDPRTAGFQAAYQAMGARACLVIPIVKEGRFVAALSFHQTAVVEWPDSEFALMEELAERLWSAIERGRAEEQRALALQQLAQERERESERLRSMFAQAPGFMCILRGPWHLFEFANAAYHKLAGHRKLIGLTVAEAFPEVAEQGFISVLDNVFMTGEPFNATGAKLLLQNAAGLMDEVYLDFIYQPILDASGGVTGIFVEGFDATERVLTRQALELSERRLKEGLVAAKMTVWDFDIETKRINYVANSEAFSGTEIKSIDQSWEHVDPVDLERLHAARAAAIAQRGSYDDLIRVNSPGASAPQWFQVGGNVICDEHGHPRSIRGVSIDVTARKLAEEALQQADRRKDEFLAMLAHELRNPLAPISAAASFLGLISDDAKKVKHISEVITRQVHHMSHLLDDLLDVSRVTSGLIELNNQVWNIETIALESIEQVRPVMEKREHHFEFIRPTERSYVLGDRMRLVQVLTNVLQNSAKFTPEKGRIALAIEVTDQQLTVVIKDNGVGIDAELLPHIFELFTQERRSSDRSQGGLGLGLALVKKLVSLHGGSIVASSEGYGRGSQFTIRFPRATASLPLPTTPTLNATEIAATSARILIVDDNPDAANVLAMLLENAGYQVDVVHDAQSALQHAQRGSKDVFLLDIGLPRIDGNQLAQLIRSLPQAKNVTLIALTGYGQEYDKSRSFAAGFDHFFVKPVPLDELLGVLENLVVSVV